MSVPIDNKNVESLNPLQNDSLDPYDPSSILYDPNLVLKGSDSSSKDNVVVPVSDENDPIKIASRDIGRKLNQFSNIQKGVVGK